MLFKHRERTPGAVHRTGAAVLLLLAMVTAPLTQAQYQPPESLNPSAPRYPDFDTSQSGEVWLVYTYEIDVDGLVKKLQIHSSNGVEEVNSAIVNHIS